MGKNLDLVLAVLPRGWSQGQIMAQLLARAEYTFGAVLYIKVCPEYNNHNRFDLKKS